MTAKPTASRCPAPHPEDPTPRTGPVVVSADDPLYDPEKDAHFGVPSLEQAIDRARKVLDEKGQASIHDRDAMIRAAYGLHYVLHDLLAALDAERGGQS